MAEPRKRWASGFYHFLGWFILLFVIPLLLEAPVEGRLAHGLAQWSRGAHCDAAFGRGSNLVG